MGINTIYDENETMKLLGQQFSLFYIGEGGIATDDFMNVIKAEKKHRQDLFSVAVDFFLLGLIYGKREERRRRKK